MELNLSSVPFIFIGIIILSGNLFLCVLYYTNRCLRSITNKFVISLAFCDVIIATIFIPLYIFHTKYGSTYVAALSSFGSLFNLSALTYERYVAIFHALRYYSIMSDNKVKLLMAEVWTGTILVTLFPLPWELTLSHRDFTQWHRIYGGILTALIVLVTVAVLMTYVKIFKISAYHASRDRSITVFSSAQTSEGNFTTTTCDMSPFAKKSAVTEPTATRNNSRRQKIFLGNSIDTDEVSLNKATRERSLRDASDNMAKSNGRRNILREVKAARIIATIFLFNFVCWLPIIIINICDVFSSTGRADYIPVTFLTASLYLFVINSLVNPFIYAFCKRDFRRVIRKKMGHIRNELR